MAKIYYHAVPVDWRKEQKYQFLEAKESIAKVKWQKLKPDKKHNWLDLGFHEEFDRFLPLGDRDAHAGGLTPPVFMEFGQGLQTNRDDWVYGFDAGVLSKRVVSTIDFYNDHVRRYQRLGKKKPAVDDFVENDRSRISWSSSLKKHLERGVELVFSDDHVRTAIYRPFTRQFVYLDKHLNHRPSVFPKAFPKRKTANPTICVTDTGARSPFSLLATEAVADMHLCASTDTFQCFPLHTYAEDGKERRDNVTLNALVRFQNFYGDDALTRADVFYYV